MKRSGILLLLLFLLPLPANGGTIEGRIIAGGEPVAGMRVEAHAGGDFSGAAVARSAPTDAAGSYRLDVPAGHYFLFARDPQRGLFAFCGRNPVAVAGESVWAGLQAVPFDQPTAIPHADPYATAIEGKLLLDGQPLAGAYVSLYLDATEDLKGQGYRISLPTGEDGSFAFDGLPESSYFLVGRWRQNGGRVGPILEGDALAVYPGNPLAATAGKSVRVTLTAVRKVQEAPASEAFTHGNGSAVRGTVTDREGKPVAGVHVFAYTERVIGHQRPEALSPPTGADGAFTLHLKTPGTYYLGARELYGDSPAPGERFGMYDESADHGIVIKTGEVVEGVKIVVEPVSLQ